MGLFSKNQKVAEKKLNWQSIESVEDLQKAWESTEVRSGIFFKHSTRCSISKMALQRFENNWGEDTEANLFFIDLLNHRDVSNSLAEISGIQHESPQVIVVKNQQPTFSTSHNGIDATTIKNEI